MATLNTRVQHLTHCRACDGSRLEEVLCLPAMPLTDDFVPPERLGQEFREDIKVFVCCDCWTTQTLHDVNMGDYYEDYQYSVGASPTAARFMTRLAANVTEKYFARRSGTRVLEVGSGDGAQLLAFQQQGCRALGYEPSSWLTRTAEAKGVPTVQGLFDAGARRHLPEEFKQADAIVLSYTLDHLPQPGAFLRTARSILDPDAGILVVEVHDLAKIFARQEFSLFEHEHTVYLTEQTAQALAAREEFVIVDFNPVAEADRRANSLLFIATPVGSRFAREPAQVSASAEFSDLSFYRSQWEKIRRGIANLDAFVDRLTAAGRTVAGYGAGGRGVLTLAAMQSAPRVRYLADRKPKRPGLVTPKSGVPLVGLDKLRESPVDDILVFSFGYMKEIQAELASMGYRPEQFHSLVDVLAGDY